MEGSKRKYPKRHIKHANSWIVDLATWILAAIAAIIIFSLAGCKSLEQKCYERFPENMRMSSIKLSTDTNLPELKLRGAIPCDEFAKTLPADGKPTILAEDDHLQIRGSRGKNGSLVLDAIRKKTTIPRKSEKTSTELSQVIKEPCKCDKEVKSALKIYRTEMLNNFFFALSIAALIFAAFMLYRIITKKNPNEINRNSN